MTIVRDKFSPSISFNNPSRRVLGINITLDSGPIVVTNVYGPNGASLRGEVWEYLQHKPCMAGILTDDFNMVESATHSSIGVAIMQARERIKWESLSNTHSLLDV